MTISKEFRSLPQGIRQELSRFLDQKPVPLGAMARHLGIRVQVRPLPAGKSGRVFRSNEGEYIIEINKFEARTRQRYTLAHELAHYLLHRDIIDEIGEISDNILYRSGIPDEKEFEANRLAADLVMPQVHIEADIERIGADKGPAESTIAALAQEWGVSSAAMEIRLGGHFVE